MLCAQFFGDGGEDDVAARLGEQKPVHREQRAVPDQLAVRDPPPGEVPQDGGADNGPRAAAHEIERDPEAHGDGASPIISPYVANNAAGRVGDDGNAAAAKKTRKDNRGKVMRDSLWDEGDQKDQMTE